MTMKWHLPVAVLMVMGFAAGVHAGGDHAAIVAAISEIRGLQSQGKFDDFLSKLHATVEKINSSDLPASDRAWHLDTLGRICIASRHFKEAGNLFTATITLQKELSRQRHAAIPEITQEQLQSGNLDQISKYTVALQDYYCATIDSAFFSHNLARLNSMQDEALEAAREFAQCRSSLESAAKGLKETVANNLKYLESSGKPQKSNLGKVETYLKYANQFLAMVAINHGALTESLGQYPAAKVKYLDGLEIAKANGFVNEKLAALNNLGLLAYREQKFDEAIEWYEQVQEHWLQKNPNSLDLAKTQINLGLAYHARSDLKNARTHMESAGKILQDHPRERHLKAIYLTNLGGLLCSERNYPESERCFRESLEILKTINSALHPDISAAQIDLSRLYCCADKMFDAVDEMHDARQNLRAHVQRVLAMQSRAQQLEFFQNKNARWFHAALTLGLKGKDTKFIAARSAEWVLNGKAVSMPVAASRSLLSQRSKSNRVAENLFDELREVRSQMGAPVLLGQYAAGAELLKREELLSQQLAQQIGAPVLEEWTSLKTVQQHLGDSVLIEIVRFEVADFSTQSPDWKGTEENYVAWIIPPHKDERVRIVDLGDAKLIDAVVAALHEGIEKTLKPTGKIPPRELRRLVEEPLEVLSKRVLAPLLPYIEKYEHWVISPDGELWRVPWTALPYQGDFLVQSKVVSCVVSGRHVVPQQFAGKLEAPAIFADVDYGAGDIFAPLANSKKEAAGIKPFLESYAAKLTGVKQEAQLITGAAATKEKFCATKRPSTLVLSSHAFFLDRPAEVDILSCCGIAFAGANQFAAKKGDGILFGIELLDQIDLRGTDLVLLSACQTAKGKVDNGEGAKSLQYAFQLAGARTLVGTLWEVPDENTAILTIDFFDNLARGDDKATALCKAQRSLIKHHRDFFEYPHPAYWAGLTMTGLWRPIAVEP